MKKRILICFIMLLATTQVMFAQTKEEKEIKQRMWGDQLDGFKLQEVPEKWKDESAVILGRTFDYEVRKTPIINNLYEGTFFHERLLLQDKAAIENYSELNTGVIMGRKGFFRYSPDKEIFIGIKIIKPNGTVKEVDINDAVVKEVESNNKKAEYKKFAIPGLEIGDILDYYYVEKRSLRVDNFLKLEAQYIPITSKYPIVIQRMALNVMRGCYLLAKSVNGAPELRFNQESEGGERIYSFVDKDRDKIDYDDYHWIFPLRQIPMIKFEAYFAKAMGKIIYSNYGFFLTQEHEMKSSLKDKEFFYLVNWTKKVLKKQYYQLDAFMSKNYRKEKDVNKLVEEAYYFFRQDCYRKGFESAYLDGLDQSFGIVDLAFAAKMSNFLDKKKIKYDFIVTPKRWDTSFDDMLLYNELAFLLRINTPEPIYLTNFDRFSLYNEIDPGFQGNEAYKINLTGGKNLTKLNMNIPVSKDNSSVSSTVLNISLSEANMQQMEVNENVSMTGSLRSQYIATVLTPYDYIYNCKNEKYNTPLLQTISSSKKNIGNVQKSMDAKIREANNDRKKNMEDNIKGEFGLKNDFNIDSIKIVSCGLWSEDPVLKYAVDFRLNEFVNKVGPNYILEIGKLMGGQISINEKEEKQRSLDIYFPFARAFENEINFEIPQGYTISGIENLNCEFSNDFCEFSSHAEIISNKLVFRTRKAYKTNFMKSENWNNLLDMLNSAEKISEQKVLLKKI